MWLLLLVAAVLVYLYYIFIKPLEHWKNRGVKQEAPFWVLNDNRKTFFQLQSFAEKLKHAYDQFPDSRYSGTYQMFLPTLVVKDPNLLKQLTVKDFDHFTDHRTPSTKPGSISSKVLFLLKGQKWRHMRAVLSPSFTSSKMKTMFALIVECAENFVNHFLQKGDDIIKLEFKDTFTRFTNDVIATAAFGIKVDSLAVPNNKFYLLGRKITDRTGFWKQLIFFGHLIVPRLFKLLRLFSSSAESTDFFRNLVTETINTREEKGIVRPDMIQLLMEARKGNQKQEENGIIDTGFATAQESDLVKEKAPNEMTNDDIAAQALIFFFAGFETVSTLMCFMSYELAVNPDIQERLRDEVLATLEDSNGKITYDALMKMKYLDMVISESLRKWPSVAAVDRVCTKPYTIQPTKPGEKPLPLDIGDLFWLPIYGIHHDPVHFPDPERFDPERFSDKNKDSIKPYTYFPFGLGPRNCIGSRFALLETKIIFFHILQHFQIVPVEKTQIPLKISSKSLNMTAEGGFWIGLKPIKGS